MAVAVDAVSATNIQFDSVTSFSGTPITATASVTAVSGSVIFQGNATHPTGVSITWNSVALSIVPSADTGFFVDNVDQRAVMYGLASPASGAKTFAGSWTNSYSGYANVMSWKGTDTTTPFKNGTNVANATSSGTTCSITVTSPTNDFAVGCLTAFPTINSANQTSWWLSNAGSTADGAANYTAGAGSTTLTCTLQVAGNYGYAACDVQVPIAAASLPPGAQSFSTPQPDRNTALFPPQLRSWVAPDRLILIGQDKLPPGGHDYSLPPAWLAPERFAQWRAWAQSRNPNLSGLDALPPGRQTNYLPDRATWRPESPPQNLLNTLYTTAPPTPPPGKQLYTRGVDPQDPFSQWRSWTQSRNPNLAGQDQLPPGQRSFDFPRGPQRGVDFQTSLNIALLTALPPGKQVWELPRQPPKGVDFVPQRNIALLAPTVALPPGRQLYSRGLDPIDPFAQWRTWSFFNISLFPPPPRPPGSQFFALPPYGPPPLVPAFALFNINLFPPPFIPPPPTFPATYYLLEDLYINEHYLPAGTIQTTQDLGGVLPIGWVPNPNVDPVDANAVAAYTAVGYQSRGLSRQQFTVLPVLPPNYVWQIINGAPTLVKVANFPRVP
jgi:hypothetical protein